MPRACRAVRSRAGRLTGVLFRVQDGAAGGDDGRAGAAGGAVGDAAELRGRRDAAAREEGQGPLPLQRLLPPVPHGADLHRRHHQEAAAALPAHERDLLQKDPRCGGQAPGHDLRAQPQGDRQDGALPQAEGARGGHARAFRQAGLWQPRAPAGAPRSHCLKKKQSERAPVHRCMCACSRRRSSRRTRR